MTAPAWIQSIEEVPAAGAWQPGDPPAAEAEGTIGFHPLANLFPLIEGPAFADLVADIRANGLREPIVLDNLLIMGGQILDGRNRFRAAGAAGVLPRFEVLPVGVDPLAYVISRNLRRRHLSESQRALIAAKLATMDVGRPAGLGPRVKPGDDAGGDIPSIEGISTAAAANLMKVGHASVERARAVVDSGTADLQRVVEAGDVSVAAAAEIARRPQADQASILAQLPRDEAGRLTTEAKTAVRRIAGELRAEATAAKKARRAEREVTLAVRQAALPDRRYGVIYADPEWRFEPYSRDSGMDRAADNHYPTSSTIDIVTRPVASIAAPDCALFLWATGPMLPQALEVMRQWGFAYKTHIVWRKAELRPSATIDQARLDRGAGSGALVLGTGYWVRSAHELLLIGTRGDVPAPAMGTQFPSVIDAPPRRHSEKPDRFAELIEAYFPSLPKIELNRRGPPRPGWDAWGNESLPAHDPETGELVDADPDVDPATAETFE